MADSTPLKKVLIVTYVFPPMAAVGVYRTMKFCKFLPEFGWQPVVLTVKSGFNFAYDNALLEELDPVMPIYRATNHEPLIWWDRRTGGLQAAGQPGGGPQTDTAKPEQPQTQPGLGSRVKRYLRQAMSTPDSTIFWAWSGVLTGWKAIRREKIDAIFSTSPPASPHVVGSKLSRFTGIPHVTDFRDLWTLNEGYALLNRPSSLARIDRWLERMIIRRCRGVVTATDSFTDAMRDYHTRLSEDRIHTITNGLDADDFGEIEFPTEKNRKFKILHLGSLYGHRNPSHFFESVTRFLEQHPECADKMEIQFIGNASGFDRAIKGTVLEKVISFPGHMPHRQVLSELWKADLLLLILGFSETTTGVIPAKLFEYVATGRPILAYAPTGEASDIIDKYQRGVTITQPDIEASCNYLWDQYQKWEASTGAPESKIALPEEFDRRYQAEHLAQILDDATSAK